ncbi:MULTISPECIES: hypothetical protein [Kribbella]|uniref:Uncharacterized protein n=2 Tax=Kribbella TaxID=182639 RepID=A0A4R0IHM3_9ACTN|nr:MULTISPECIES: hypothetical protein [Kribbella]TCC30508.1 hypothetical protein E0H50_24175 [Kribbella sindirgiensis]TCC33216.1 hypothetical protein E0H92_34290 [Kribbella speibonae]
MARDDPLTRGIAMGVARLERYGVVAELNDVELATRQAVDVIARLDVPSRGAELLAEHIVIATIMRVVNNEGPLTADEIDAYLAAAGPFFNSFWHDDL